MTFNEWWEDTGQHLPANQLDAARDAWEAAEAQTTVKITDLRNHEPSPTERMCVLALDPNATYDRGAHWRAEELLKAELVRLGSTEIVRLFELASTQFNFGYEHDNAVYAPGEY